jgi:oligopeptide/dipeptide ABC transporter ATP-binding protein
VGKQVSEAILIHCDIDKEAAWEKSVELLDLVGIPDPTRRADCYPHELSGGMAQRVMIAMGLACEPELLIADEPSTALDVTIQAQILDLLRELQDKLHMAVLLITHDLGVVAETADRVAVMYAGQIVEEVDVESLFARPLHPYSQGLMRSIPVLGEEKDELDVIPGFVPSLIDLPAGCRFAPRCRAHRAHGREICLQTTPDLEIAKLGHKARCWLYQAYP